MLPETLLNLVSYRCTFLNQADTGMRPACVWILEITLCRYVYICIRVYILELYRSIIRTLYDSDWFNNIIRHGHGLCDKMIMSCQLQPKKIKALAVIIARKVAACAVHY